MSTIKELKERGKLIRAEIKQLMNDNADIFFKLHELQKELRTIPKLIETEQEKNRDRYQDRKLEKYLKSKQECLWCGEFFTGATIDTHERNCPKKVSIWGNGPKTQMQYIEEHKIKTIAEAQGTISARKEIARLEKKAHEDKELLRE